jgi:hypothetical protein
MPGLARELCTAGDTIAAAPSLGPLDRVPTITYRNNGQLTATAARRQHKFKKKQ